MTHFTFPVTIKTSRRARNLRISIKPNGDVVLTKPWLVPECIARQFIDTHANWIQSKLALIAPSQKLHEVYLYKGQAYKIKFLEGRFKYTFSAATLDLSGPSIEAALRTLESVHIKEASSEIRSSVKRKAQLMGAAYFSIRIKDQESRWGSCSSKGNLNFSWRLIKAPQKVMEYVIIHELSHITHMDHSKEFWKQVERYDPQYREHRRWLRRNQELMK